jgi:hypothetical protein
MKLQSFAVKYKFDIDAAKRRANKSFYCQDHDAKGTRTIYKNVN